MGYVGDKKREYDRIWVAKRRHEYFKDKVCSSCGSAINLELHHLNPDEKESHNIWSWSETRRNSEISKCVVLCSACHKIISDEQMKVPLTHGTYSRGYEKRCRCSLCMEAMRVYWREYRLSKK